MEVPKLILDELLNRRLRLVLKLPSVVGDGRQMTALPITTLEGEVMNAIRLDDGDLLLTGILVTEKGERMEMGFKLSLLAYYVEPLMNRIVEAKTLPGKER